MSSGTLVALHELVFTARIQSRGSLTALASSLRSVQCYWKNASPLAFTEMITRQFPPSLAEELGQAMALKI